MSTPSISVLVLTKNEEADLPGCLRSVVWSDDINVLDSYSTDRTLDVAASVGARITRRNFDNWASHQNWALQNIKFRHPWVFYIAADERASPELISAMTAVTTADSPFSAFQIQRRDFFADGKWLRHAQISPYYLRLFRPTKMRYERLVNPV